MVVYFVKGEMKYLDLIKEFNIARGTVLVLFCFFPFFFLFVAVIIKVKPSLFAAFQVVGRWCDRS